MAEGADRHRIRKAMEERDYVLVNSMLSEKKKVGAADYEIWIRSLFMDGDYEGCLEKCKFLLSIDGENWQAKIFSARSKYSMGDLERSLEEYKILNRDFPNEAEPYIFIIRNLYNNEKFRSSLSLAEELLTIEPDNREGLLFRARIFHQEGQIEMALEAYYKLVEYYPEHLEGNSRIGQLHYELRKFEKSKSFLLKALEIDDEYRPARRLIGLCLDKLGESEEALTWLLKEAEREPHVVSNWEKAIDVHLRTSNDEAAQDLVRIAASTVEDPIESASLFYSLARSINWRKGVEEATSKLERDGKNDFKFCKLMFSKSIEVGSISDAYVHLEKMSFAENKNLDLFEKSKEDLDRILELTDTSMEDLREKIELGEEVHVSELAVSKIIKISKDKKSRKPRNRGLKIMHVSSSMGRGGAERQLINCIKGMSKEAGVSSVSLCTYEKQGADSLMGEIEEIGIDVYEYGEKRDFSQEIKELGISNLEDLLGLLPSRFAQDFVQLYSIFIRNRPGIVHSWQDGTNIVAGLAALVARVPTVIMFGRSMRPDAKTMAHVRNRPYLRGGYIGLLDDPRVCLCLNSHRGKVSYAKWLGKSEEDLYVLHNGLDISSMREKTDDDGIRGFLENYQIPDDANVVGGVFRFVREKRLSLWIEAAFKTIENREGVFFIAVGDGPERDRVLEMVKNSSYKDKILFPGKSSSVSSWLEIFDLFLLTSEIEGLPNVLIEAQGHGIPVLSTRAGGAEDTFKNFDSGVLLIDEDSRSIAEQICICLDDYSWRNRAKEKAVVFSEERFSIEGMIQNLETLYLGRVNRDMDRWKDNANLFSRILATVGME